MPTPREYNRDDLVMLLGDVAAGAQRGGRLFLVGDASHVYENWTPATGGFVLASAPGGEWLEGAVLQSAERLKTPVTWESPAQVVPLPAGHERRARETDLRWDTPGGALEVHHFDPYSVAFRAIARGDEPDYRAALQYLRHGWITVGEMDTLLDGVLPKFTNETISQDPAEFRRKYKGLLQMWRAEDRVARERTAVAG